MTDGFAPIVDAHNDLLIELAFRGLRNGEPSVFADRCLPHLRQGGVRLQACPLYADLSSLPESALRQVLAQVAAFERGVRENPDSTIAVKDAADLERVERGGPIGPMLSLEGAEPLGYDRWMVGVFWALGVLMIGLTWNRRNPFADGAAEEGAGGLSQIGKASNWEGPATSATTSTTYRFSCYRRRRRRRRHKEEDAHRG